MSLLEENYDNTNGNDFPVFRRKHLCCFEHQKAEIFSGLIYNSDSKISDTLLILEIYFSTLCLRMLTDTHNM